MSLAQLRLNKHNHVARSAPTVVLFLVVLGAFAGFSVFSSLGGLPKSKSIQGQQQCVGRRRSSASSCNFVEGQWVFDSSRSPLYTENCPFQRNAWNCGRNKKPNMDEIQKWRWEPRGCSLPVIDPHKFMDAVRNMNIGFVGDSLNENFIVSLLCILRAADPGAFKWKKKKAWRGAHFPKYNVTVGYHRAVLLADYQEWQPTSPTGPLESKGFTSGFRVNVDIPAADWSNVLDFYDVYVFNTGHWWGSDKFPSHKPLLFYKQGKPIIPPLSLRAGLQAVLEHMIAYAERSIPPTALKIWRLQSPRHFEGGEWNENGSCQASTLLRASQVEEWFGLGKGGVNKEARELNAIIVNALGGSNFSMLNVSYLSEFRRDAHPAIWLGQRNAHVIWGQDCMHWCLPGLPDIWVDILSMMILKHLDSRQTC